MLQSPDLRPVDQARAARAALAWLRGDQLAFNVALDDANREPAGTAGLVFALVDMLVDATRLLSADDADAEQRLQTVVEHYATRDEDQAG